MSTTEGLDVSQEPRKVFQSYLIKAMNEAKFFIFLRPELEATGLNVLDAIVSSLNEQHQNALKEIHAKVRSASLQGGPKVDARQAFQEIFRYLHKSYLEEISVGIVPTAGLKPGETDRSAPTEKINERVKAKL